MKRRYWDLVPLRNAILNAIAKRQGILLDNELFTMLQKDFKDLSYTKLNKALMALEIEGVVHVSQITKTKRRIEVMKEGEGFLLVGED
ncbi:MAG: hypothetical protein ACFFBS_01040 [Promethearchaeota archaeon]